MPCQEVGVFALRGVPCGEVTLAAGPRMGHRRTRMEAGGLSEDACSIRVRGGGVQAAAVEIEISEWIPEYLKVSLPGRLEKQHR